MREQDWRGDVTGVRLRPYCVFCEKIMEFFVAQHLNCRILCAAN